MRRLILFMLLVFDTQVIVTIGPFVDVGDGFTPQTDIGLAGNEAELIKHGSNAVVDISGATWAAVTNCRGYYSLTLTTSHTDTEGQLTVVVQDDSDCLPVRNTFMVLNDNTYEAFFENASEMLTVNVTQVSGTSQTANDNGADINTLITQVGTAGNGLTSINLPNQTMDIVGDVTGNLSGSVGSVTGEVDLGKIKGTALTETNAGDLADSVTFFFDVDPTTTKTVDDVGAVASGGGSSLVLSVGNLGNYKEDNVIVFAWRSIDQGGAAVNPSSAGTIKIYKENSDVEVTAPTGITDTRGFDGITGVHLCVVDLSASTFYARNQDYSIVLTGATVDSQSVTAVVGTFSIEKRYVDEFER